MTAYADFYRRSIDDRDGFWAEEAKAIDWQTPPQQVCDYSNPPFARWFVAAPRICAITRLTATWQPVPIRPR